MISSWWTWWRLTATIVACLLSVSGYTNRLMAGAVAQPVTALRITDDTGQPLADASLRILCYATIDATEPVADLLFTTNAAGHLVQPLPLDCVYAAVLHRLHRQPSGKPGRGDAYTIYNTSWAPGTRQLHPTAGDIAVRTAWRLVLFDVAVSLEWTPPVTSPYTTEMRTGFLHAADYLYDLTEGQMSFGPFDLTVGGAGWESADVRVRAANDYRPTAQVGGMVGQPIRYTAPTGKQPVFSPGEIWVGRYWNGRDGADPVAGAWTTPAAYRTLVHEWLHYALFLYDEYQDLNDDGRVETYCTCRDLPTLTDIADANLCQGSTTALAASALAYHYTATELWQADTPSTCTHSDHYFVHGESDWATLVRWSAIQGIPTEWLRQPPQLTPGPALGLTADLFGRRPSPAPTALRYFLPTILHPGANHATMATFSQATPLPTRNDITVTLAISPPLPLPALRSIQPQLYGQEVLTPAGLPHRLVYQGTVTPSQPGPDQVGQALLLGVSATDNLHVTAARYGPRERVRGLFATPLQGHPLSATTVLLTPDAWPASLDITPGLEGPALRTLTVTLTSRDAITVTPVAQLCTPAIGCPALSGQRQVLQQTGALTWTATFTASAPAELPHYAILHVEAPGVGQLLRWFQTPGGVGPAHVDQHAPLRDGLIMVDATAPLTQTTSRVVVMPAADANAVFAPLPPGIEGVVGQPLDIDIHLAGLSALPTTDRQLPTPMLLTFFYSPAHLERLAITPAHLTLLHYLRSRQQWQVVPASGSSMALNWLATKPVTEDGIYAIGYAQAPDFGRVPQKFADLGPVAPGEPIRYLIALPASATLTATAEAFIGDQLPSFVQVVDGPVCNRGVCGYFGQFRSMQWQGQLAAGDLVLLSYTVTIDPTLPPSACPPQLVNQAVAFDGAQQHPLSATTQIQCAGK